MIHISGRGFSYRGRTAVQERGHAMSRTVSPYSDLIVSFCPTGMIPTKPTTPHAPITPAEVIDEACGALEQGVALVHLHAPDEQEKAFETMILGIRGHFPDAIVCVSGSGRSHSSFERRSEILELTGAARPDLASLPMTSLDFPIGTNQNAPEMVMALAERMVARGIKPEVECLDFGMISAANMLISKGLLGEPPYYFSLLLSSGYSVPVTARHLSNMVEDLPQDSLWSAAGTGLFQVPVNTLAVAMGGHCRLWPEGNIYQGLRRTALATKLGLVERVKLLTESFGRPLASSQHARRLLGLGPSASHQLADFDYDERSGQPTHV
ncbi:MAG: 3-keto-5-aminohexanoate cleavage protein [Gemmatimonadales bacterium]|nr:3-keto-5-aminohexanoate cleavage protein [Gemmatimonadales bacterium]